MRVPLRYQASSYDCGAATAMNAISFLFEREEVPPAVIRQVALVTLDRYDEDGRPGNEGTSPWAMRFLSLWLNDFGAQTGFPISCGFLSGDEVRFGDGGRLDEAVGAGAAVILRCWVDGDDHYVLVTGRDGDRLRVFDPYALAPGEHGDDPAVTRVDGRPCEFNRLVSLDRLECGELLWYTLDGMRPREAVVVTRTDARARDGEATPSRA